MTNVTDFPAPPPAPAEAARTTFAPSAKLLDPSRVATKRAMDVLGASLGLLTLSPFLLLIAIAVRLDSAGPIFFHQVRVGRDRRRRDAGPPPGTPERRVRPGFGQEFHMYKFRTMRQDSPTYSRSPQDTSDPRVTRVGRTLRRTSLDELPQLLNVLASDMSLVGPRPEMPFIVATYQPVHRRRLEAKPGVTGLWQLYGPRDRPMHEVIEWDLQYIESWSLRLDAKVLWNTVLFVLRARNF
jgi:lipopolysaccharide/colanic/teichoic acid biosynthesis glycosyltransferase